MKILSSFRFLVCLLPLLPSCSTTNSTAPAIVAKSTKQGHSASSAKSAELGVASIYTDKRTASGERYSASALAAAHKQLPLGSKVKVTNLGNGRSCVVRINDRGPYKKGRIIDLTPTAASSIGLGYRQGLAKVKVERL